MLDNNVILKQRLEQFDLKHGNDGVISGRWLLFADGAMRETRQPGELIEPPASEVQRAKLQVRYREIQLQHSVRQYQEASNRVVETPSQRVARWIEENGDDGIMVDGWMIYSNGAMREATPLGALLDPPADLYERAKIKVRYRQALMQRAADAFNERKRYLLSAAEAARRNGYPPPTERELTELKQLQQVVQKCQRDLEATRTEVVKHTPAWMQSSATTAQENQQSGERFIADVTGIKV